MGGGRKFEYPKWVWSPAGGWWPNPTNWKRNSVIFSVFAVGLMWAANDFGERNTVSTFPILVQTC